MKFLKRLFEFYINASIHVALSVCSLCAITILQFDLDWDYGFLVFVLLASITGYNFVKFFGLAKFHYRSLASWLKSIQIFSLLCFLGMVIFAFSLSVGSLLCLCLMGLITFLYAVPFLPRRFFIDKQQNLRSIGGIKIFVIAIVWAGTTVILPVVEASKAIDAEVLLVSVQRFIFVLILMLPFEIRDLQYDSIKLATIPQKIGVKATKLLGAILIIVFLILELVILDHNENDWTILVLTGLLMTALFYSGKNQAPYFCSFFVEAIPIIWLLLLTIA